MGACQPHKLHLDNNGNLVTSNVLNFHHTYN